MNLTLGMMNKSNVKTAINDALSLAMLDMVAGDIPSMSYREISNRTGMTYDEVKNAEQKGLAKLRLNPLAWEIVTACKRTKTL
jgi:hypothetical protein